MLDPRRRKSVLILDHLQALEEDFIECTRYVSFAKANRNTYSIEFTRLLQEAGSIFDVLCKRICKDHNQPSRNILDYRRMLLSIWPELTGAGLGVLRYEADFYPFQSWAKPPKPGKAEPPNPRWWRAYNAVKHDRLEKYGQGNMANVVNALAACNLARLRGAPLVYESLIFR